MPTSNEELSLFKNIVRATRVPAADIPKAIEAIRSLLSAKPAATATPDRKLSGAKDRIERGGKDRRQISLPVDNDRRKNNRRKNKDRRGKR